MALFVAAEVLAAHRLGGRVTGAIGDSAGARWVNLYGALVVAATLVVTLPALKLLTGSLNPVETVQARAA